MLKIQEKRHGNITVLELHGSFDLNDHQFIEDKIHHLLTEDRKLIVFQCHRLSYISSAGIKSIILTLRKLDTVRGKLALCKLSEQIYHTFKKTGYAGLFPIFETEDEAINNLIEHGY